VRPRELAEVDTGHRQDDVGVNPSTQPKERRA